MKNEEEVWRLPSRDRSGHHVRRYAMLLTFRLSQFPGIDTTCEDYLLQARLSLPTW